MSLFSKYCMDTSAIIDAAGRTFPVELYPDVWNRIDKGFSDGIIVAPREVRRELLKGSAGDFLQQWAKDNSGYFVNPDITQTDLMSILVNTQPVCDPLNFRAIDADPWVIVLAQATGLTVVTSENQISSKKIPHFCRELGIPVADLPGFFSLEGWVFHL